MMLHCIFCTTHYQRLFNNGQIKEPVQNCGEVRNCEGCLYGEKLATIL